MADRVTREIVHDRDDSPSWLSWLALLVAIAALIVGWLAYNRSGEDLEDRIKRQVESSMQSADRNTQGAQEAIDEGPDGVDEDTSPQIPGN